MAMGKALFGRALTNQQYADPCDHKERYGVEMF